MNVTGSFVPPLFIFPRQRMKAELMDGSPPGSICVCHPSGWMQMEIFSQWFDHFVSCSGASKTNPVLLILDGHSTHVRNLDVINKAWDHGVVIICLPPHCSHKMQPLDVSFMKPLSTYYNAEVSKWLRNDPGRTVSTFQVAQLLTPAFQKAATALTAANGFRKLECGLSIATYLKTMSLHHQILQTNPSQSQGNLSHQILQTNCSQSQSNLSHQILVVPYHLAYLFY